MDIPYHLKHLKIINTYAHYKPFESFVQDIVGYIKYYFPLYMWLMHTLI